MALEQSNEDSSMPARTSHSKEHSRIPAVVERAQALISDDPGQSLHVLMDVMKPWMEIMSVRKAIHFSARYTNSYQLTQSTSICFGLRNSGLIKDCY